MIDKKKAFRRLLPLMIALCFSQACAAKTTSVQPNTKQREQLNDYLIKVGQKLSLFFTVEVKQPNSRTLSPLQTAVVLSRPQPTTRKGLLLLLQGALPYATVFQDGNATNVIHIVETSLNDDGNYVLNKQINFKFSGRLNDLPEALSSPLQGGIGTQRVFAVGQVTMDFFTRVNFDVKNQTVRSILTDPVPIPKYSRILWDAVSQEVNGKLKTSIAYHG